MGQVLIPSDPLSLGVQSIRFFSVPSTYFHQSVFPIIPLFIISRYPFKMRVATIILAFLPFLRAYAQNAPSSQADIENRETAQDVAPAQQDHCSTSSSVGTVLTVTENITVATCTQQCIHPEPTAVLEKGTSSNTPLPDVSESPAAKAQISASTEPLNTSTTTVYTTFYAYSCASGAPVSALQAMDNFTSVSPHWTNQTEPTILLLDPETSNSAATPSSYPTNAMSTPPCPTNSSTGPQSTSTESQLPVIGNSGAQVMASSLFSLIYLAFMAIFGTI